MGIDIARAGVNMFDGMTEQDRKAYVASMINDNEEPVEMEYDMEKTIAFVLGATTDPNPSKKKNEINDRRALDTARTAVAAKQAARMHEEEASRMQAEMAVQTMQDKLYEQNAYTNASG
ncbi:hypothetical protein D1007_11867 [Hordeum vulgare]|nr:hypothetical protein D1007_11867 [Hordeum vulgare]